MGLFQTLRHLLPDSPVWRLPAGSTIKKLFEGLAAQPDVHKTFADESYEDSFPATTRELDAWEQEHGLLSEGGNEAARRAAFGAELKLTGGQSAHYMQERLADAGFDGLRVYESWSSEDPFVFRDPRNYVNNLYIGTSQCHGYDESNDPLPSQPQCTTGVDDNGDPVFQHQCNRFLSGEDPGYIVNVTLTGAAPPPISSDPDTWPAYIYVMGTTFGQPGVIDMTRLPSLKRLLVKLRPLHKWIILSVIDTSEVIDPSNVFEFEDGLGFDLSIWGA